jgi:hypothetical protein
MTVTLSVDSEYGWRGGVQIPSAFVPVVICIINLQTDERRVFWGRDPRLADFIRDHADDEFVAHNMVAEAKYLLQLGITPPARWFDTMLAFRYHTNAEYVRPYGLLKAAVGLGLPIPISQGEKEEMETWIGELRFDPNSPDDRARIRDYCLGDCRVGISLYNRLVKEIPRVWMAYATEFCLATARQELRGVPFDVGIYALLQERKTEVLALVQGDVNRVHPVFRDGSLDKAQLLAWCGARGIGWPKEWSKKTSRWTLSFDDDAFKRVEGRDPFLVTVRQANRTTKHLNDRDLAVDFNNGRHYYGNIPCAQKASRTSFTGSLFGAPRWMRFFIVPTSDDHVVVVVDFKAEEILIAAYLSDDLAMLRGYESGDPHMNFAVLAGAAPPGANPKVPPYDGIRKRYKAINLGVNYGLSAYGIAESTGMYYAEAKKFLAQHHAAFPDYWAWTRAYTAEAFARGWCRTKAGWPREVGRKDNPRSVANFAVQGTGADLMRLAVIHLTRAGTPLLATIHDGFVFECLRDDLSRLRRAIDAALGQAVEQLLPGARMTWTTDECTGRYEVDDDYSTTLWNLVRNTLTGSCTSSGLTGSRINPRKILA